MPFTFSRKIETKKYVYNFFLWSVHHSHFALLRFSIWCRIHSNSVLIRPRKFSRPVASCWVSTILFSIVLLFRYLNHWIFVESYVHGIGINFAFRYRLSLDLLYILRAPSHPRDVGSAKTSNPGVVSFFDQLNRLQLVDRGLGIVPKLNVSFLFRATALTAVTLGVPILPIVGDLNISN